jgi:hypothetical protein
MENVLANAGGGAERGIRRLKAKKTNNDKFFTLCSLPYHFV